MFPWRNGSQPGIAYFLFDQKKPVAERVRVLFRAMTRYEYNLVQIGIGNRISTMGRSELSIEERARIATDTELDVAASVTQEIRFPKGDPIKDKAKIREEFEAMPDAEFSHQWLQFRTGAELELQEKKDSSSQQNSEKSELVRS